MGKASGRRPASPRAAASQAKLVAAITHLQGGRLREAQAAYRNVLAAEPRQPLALHHLGIVEHQLGDSAEAVRLIRQSLVLKPGSPQAQSDLAVILMQTGRDDEAIAACRAAIALDGRFALAHCNLGDLLARRGDHRGAEGAYAEAIALQPSLAAAQSGRAEALTALGRPDEALAACDAALRLAPGFARAHAAKGLALHRLQRADEAIAAYEAALAANPCQPLIHSRIGNVLRGERRFDAALAAQRRAIQIDHGCAEAHCNLALTLSALGAVEEALAAFARALAIYPALAEAQTGLGLLLHRIGRQAEALAALRAAAQAPNPGFALRALGSVLKDQGRLEEAAEVYRRLLTLPEVPPAARYEACNLRRHICDWPGLEEEERRAVGSVLASGEPVPPFAALAMDCTPEDHLALARLWSKGLAAQAPLSRPAAPRMAKSGRIRIGYLSSDFFQHATASLIAELIERHDRQRFEIFAFCTSPEDRSPMRRRLMAGFDRFTVLLGLPHAEAAGLIATQRVDILIDLKGYTRNAPSAIMAQRAAPIQVNYLGYPSTMGAPFIDYVIADSFVAPTAHQAFYDEKIVQLPHCYQPNDGMRRPAGPVPSRATCGLPEQGFVFCSFNNAYKITAAVFGVWMRLLARRPGSVLWLLDANSLAKANLRREAAARGIDPDRLVFAPKLSTAEHLSRYPLADLFLDNLPVNAHTTASEALWSGLPVVTCAGEIFAGRVAGSLLTACGLSELITASLDEYEALALDLSGDPVRLGRLREMAAKTRAVSPLFDIERYRRGLEAALLHMINLHRQGQPPQAFTVPPEAC